MQMFSFSFSDLSQTKRAHVVGNLSAYASKSYFDNLLNSSTTPDKGMNVRKTSTEFSRLKIPGVLKNR